MRILSAHGFIPFILCASVLVGQQTYVVDAGAGPGHHFTDIAQAAAVVPDGSILVVRPGGYGPVTLRGKGLTILAERSVFLNCIGSPSLQVVDLPASSSFTLRGGNIGWGNEVGAQITLQRCRGPVLIEGFTFDQRTMPRLSPPVSQLPGGLLIDSCDQVTLRRCYISSYKAVIAFSTALALDECSMWGTGSTFVTRPTWYGVPALELTSTTVFLSRSSIRGGPGALISSPPATAIRMSRSTIRISGGVGLVAAGPLIGGNYPNSAIEGTGTVIRDPSVAILPQGGAPAVAAGIVDRITAVPSVGASGGPIGSTVTADVTGAHGSLAVLFLSWPALPIAFPGVDGDVWIDPTSAQFMAAGIPTPTAPIQASIAVPNRTSLIGVRCAWQAAVVGPSGVTVSNPSTYVHTR